MKKQIIHRLFKIFTIGLVVALTFNLASPNFFSDSTAYAVGDLNVNWVVPDGAPIFVVTNMLPGDVESRTVSVINNGTISRTVAIRGVKTAETLNFATVLDFIITDGATPVYGTGSPTGTKTLQEFFDDSGDINGIPLSTLAPSAATTYTFTATFNSAAGNEFQNALVIFDLIIGINIDDSNIPAECRLIDFTGNPIFGTAGNDKIKGTNGNDLIIALEGNDKVNGSNGDDCIIGGPGNDNLDGGSNGKDVVFGNEGDDIVDGSNGVDFLSGGSGNDKIYGTNGNDQMFGDDGDDLLDGSNGDDYMLGGSGNDTFDGGNGDDYIEGNAGNDTMVGRNGNDTLIGGNDTDKATGSLGTDTCDAETEASCEI